MHRLTTLLAFRYHWATTQEAIQVQKDSGPNNKRKSTNFGRRETSRTSQGDVRYEDFKHEKSSCLLLNI